LYSGDKEASSAIRKHHEQYLEKATTAIAEQSLDERDFSGIVIPVDRKDIPKIKQEIKDFRKKINQTYRKKNADEVYRLSLQLFRLTNLTK
jgi:uncharacterized protein (TIGR02147 family)